MNRTRSLTRWLAIRVAAGGILLASLFLPPAVAEAAPALSLALPSQVTLDASNAIMLHLPNSIGAIEGRVLVDSSVAELVGVAPAASGTALSPVEIPGGYAFGAYGLRAKGGHNDLRLVFVPYAQGQIDVHVVVDAAANRLGRRIAVANANLSGSVRIGRGGGHHQAPNGAPRSAPTRAAGPLRALFGRDVISQDDLDIARAAWYASRDNACQQSGTPSGDANGDGCVDVIDLQALSVNIGGAAANAWGPADGGASTVSSQTTSEHATTNALTSAATTGLAFTVNSTADTPDAHYGDGVCADSNGRCTLRAAMDESNWDNGHNTINFNIAGTAPIVIQLGSATTQLLGSSSSSVTIDGYSQPGSRVNTATYGTNAIPGIELRGNGPSNTRYILYSARPDNVVRGIIFANAYRAIFLDTAGATNNQIVGNWMGFNRDGSLSALGHAGVYIINGAHDNIVGTAALEDRNVIGNYDKAVYGYGPGADHNIVQNNDLCISPTGATAVCATGIDFDFGPKAWLVGGSNPGEQNVIGATSLNGIELSHGWDPSTNHVSTPQYQINDNQIIGNWVGFRADGSYDPAYRSAQQTPSADNGQALHAYDGSNNNLFQANYVAAAYDGVTIASNNSTGNIVRGNIIGRSPQGQPAPLQRYGIYFTSNTHGQTVEQNIIDNAAVGGIEIIDPYSLNIRISQNLVFNTNGPAIYLAPDPNNPGAGANELLPAPTVTGASTASVVGTGISGATVEVFQASRATGAYGLPIAYLGAATVASDGQWSVSVNLQLGQRVTATEIATNGDTSSLAANVVVGSAPALVADFTWQQQSNSLAVDFTDTSSGEPTSWSWDLGDGSSSTAQNPSHTYATAGDYTVTLTATNDSGNDSSTHVVTVAPVATGTDLVSDTFSRNQNNGWGSADIGGLYTLEGQNSNFSVSGGAGSIIVPKAGANRAAFLDGVSATDVDLSVRVAADQVPAGGAYFAYVEARHNGGNSYRGTVIFRPDGTINVQGSVVINGSESALGPQVSVPGVTAGVGDYVWLHVQISGSNPTTINVRAWADGQSEPAAWQFSATDSHAAVEGAGGVGLRAYVSRSATTAPVTFSFDDFTAAQTSPPPPPPPGAVASDTFERSVSAGWGVADTGGVYTLLGSSANYSVGSGVGSMLVPSAGVSRGAWLGSTSATNVDITFRVAVNNVAAGANEWVYAVARRNNNNEYRPRLILKSDGSVAVSVSVVNGGSESGLGQATVPGLTQTPGGFIWVHAQVTGSSPTTININAWADGQAEPAGWQFSVTDSTASVQGAGAVGLLAYLSRGSTNVPVTFSFDDYSVTDI